MQSRFFPGETDPLIIGMNADPDHDGESNAFEFALGGKPNSGSDTRQNLRTHSQMEVLMQIRNRNFF